MNKKKIYSTLVSFGLLMSVQSIHAQTSLNTASNRATINGNTFEYSIGEMTLISTEHSGNLIVTQGYLQPAADATSSQNHSDDGLNTLSSLIKVYPNPTDNILFIETPDVLNDAFSYQLIDATGKVVIAQQDAQKISTNKFSLNLTALAAGNYYLMIHDIETLSYKIQKTH
ncbi:MAG: T9SS type A sorting domain-containing protein [Bacteroidetes bacterium]|nr:T9SS type A sorting domain-containing protein [Bacteroidota bacterium]